MADDSLDCLSDIGDDGSGSEGLAFEDCLDALSELAPGDADADDLSGLSDVHVGSGWFV